MKMNSTEITLYFEEAKAAALKAVLVQDGATIESKLQESLRFLYGSSSLWNSSLRLMR